MTNATSQIHCSARTLKEIGLPPKSVGYGDPETDQFFCWYCNLLYINRKKHLMFVNAATRYPLLSAEVTRTDIRSLNSVLAFSLVLQLRDEGVSHDVIHHLTSDLANPILAKSNNRSIIGTAVEYERMMWAYLAPSAHARTPETPTQMGLKLARVPIPKMRPDPFPYRVFRDQLLARYGDTGHFDFNPVSLKRNCSN
jgi:hypothetical protein